MKRSILTRSIGILALANLMACQPKNPADPNVPEKKNTDEKAALPLSIQPGKITLIGQIAVSARASQGSDGPIVIAPQTGTNADGQQAPLAKENEPVLIDNVAADVIEALKKNFETKTLALGCSADQKLANLGDPKPAEPNLASDTAKTVTIEAKHVLICGNPQLRADSSLVINAEEVTLLDAKLVLKSPASVTLKTRTLTLKGQNRISTGPTAGNEEPKATEETAAGLILEKTASSSPASAPAQSPAPEKEAAGGAISLTVVDKLGAEKATLTVATQGANQKKAEASK